MMYNRLHKIFKDRSGFSLLEIVVAAAIGSVIMLMIYSAHRAIVYSVKDLAGVAEFHENLNLSIRRLERDISCIIVNQDNKQIKFKGENNMSGAVSAGRIEMVTINRHSFIAIGDITAESHQTDVKEVHYFLKPDPKYHGLFFLIRSEKNLYDTHTDEGSSDTVAPETESLMLENVVDIKFEFTGDANWSDKWTETNPPRAVRTMLKLKNYRGKDEVFTFTSILHMVKKGS